MAHLNSYKEPEFQKKEPLAVDVRLPNMLPVPGGVFLMGTSDDDIQHLELKQSDWAYDWAYNNMFENERPQHTVNLGSFEIAQYPITNSEYYQFTTDTGYRLPRAWDGFTFSEEFGDHPVTGVSRVDAQQYILWLNKRTGSEYRLPTEEEWECAARGKDGRIYPWGNTFDPWRCNTSESAKRGTTPVGAYSPSGDSPCGAADMVGNVWEWTSSIFARYASDPEDTQDIPPAKIRYVVRGGGWYYSRKLARCAARESMLQDYISRVIGFRLARAVGKSTT